MTLQSVEKREQLMQQLIQLLPPEHRSPQLLWDLVDEGVLERSGVEIIVSRIAAKLLEPLITQGVREGGDYLKKPSSF